MINEILQVANQAYAATESMRNIINKEHDHHRALVHTDSDAKADLEELQELRRNYENCKIALHEQLIQLLFHIRDILPRESDYLQMYLSGLVGGGEINPYDFGGINLIVPLIRDKIASYEEFSYSSKKLFISHSSDDADKIRKFIDDILILGCGLSSDQIFCTSIDSTGVKVGQDLRNDIKSQIKGSAMVLLMISENYLKSSICLNEMGAAWVLDKVTLPLLFPEIKFDEMGWLVESRKGIKLSNQESLDELKDTITETFETGKDIKQSDWTHRKNQFISSI